MKPTTVETFAELNLDPNIYKAIAACGYTTPTPVQSKSIPPVLAGKDVAVSAQTGTGKTAAFVLPALHNLSLQPPTKQTRVLILTPTRELASQITKAAGLYGKYLKFNIVNLVGGMPYHTQIKELARGADIIVATPGRLMDHIEQRRVDLSNVEMLVLDEADRMLDMGFIDDVQYIAKLTPSKRQTLLFSATLDGKLMSAVKHLLKTPVRIDLSSEKISAPLIQQEMYKATSAHHKMRLLKHFLRDENIFKAIIFSATKVNADRITEQLCDDGFSAAALHGDLRQNVRNRTLEQLRRGKIQFLVATDVAARGIDVSDITHVFNFDLPRFCEDYVHRIGRTGRAGKTGTAISFVLPTDSRLLQSIERYIGQRIKVIQNVDLTQAPDPVSEETLTLRKRQANAIHEDTDDDRPKRRSSYKGRESSGGASRERSFSGERRERSFGGEKRERSFSGEKRERSFSGEKRERSFAGGEKRDRPFAGSGEKRERSFAGDGEKRERSFSGEKRARPFAGSGEKRERSFSGEKRERSFGGEKRERSSTGEKRARPFAGSGEKRERSFSGEKSERSFSGEKRARPFAGSGEKRERSFSGEKRERSSTGEKRERSFSGEKRARPFAASGEKRERSFGGEKRARPFADKGEKRERSFSKDGAKPAFKAKKPAAKGRKFTDRTDRA